MAFAQCMLSHLASIDQQKTMQLPSGGHANSNGMTIVPMNESTDLANFHAKQRLTQSTPGSPQDHARSTSNEPGSIEVVGSAESLVGKVRRLLKKNKIIDRFQFGRRQQLIVSV